MSTACIVSDLTISRLTWFDVDVLCRQLDSYTTLLLLWAKLRTGKILFDFLHKLLVYC